MIGSTVFYPKKKASVTKLNLVALMDIFTILVFFLLLNTGESQKIENAKFIELPDSVSGAVPHNELLIFIGEEEIWFGEQQIARVADVLKTPSNLIEPLTQALAQHKQTLGQLSDFEQEQGLSVTIMGEKSVSYPLLKAVMATCQGSDYRNISLAVNQVVSDLPQAEVVPAAVSNLSKSGR